MIWVEASFWIKTILIQRQWLLSSTDDNQWFNALSNVHIIRKETFFICINSNIIARCRPWATTCWTKLSRKSAKNPFSPKSWKLPWKLDRFLPLIHWEIKKSYFLWTTCTLGGFCGAQHERFAHLAATWHGHWRCP